MNTVSSRANPLFKMLHKLVSSARERKKTGTTVLDGVHLIAAYRGAIGEPEMLVVTATGLQRAEVLRLLNNFPKLKPVVMTAVLFGEISPVDAPTGILAVVHIPDAAASGGRNDFCALLEDIQDPGNLGSILRSAAAAGAGAIYLSQGCADPWSPKVLRAGMGAHFYLRIHERADLVAVARKFTGQVVATAPMARNSLHNLSMTGATAFMFGNEGQGLSAALLKCAHQRVCVPIPGRVESLNAAAAAAICFFEKVRQESHRG